MKTTFSRQFAMIAALLLLCLLITGVSFRFLMLGTIESQNQQTMIRDAEAVAELAEAYDSVGDLQNNFDFHISLSLFTKVGDAEALLDAYGLEDVPIGRLDLTPSLIERARAERRDAPLA